MREGSDSDNIEEFIHRQSEFYDVLSNALRLKILYHLGDDREHVGGLADALDRSTDNVSHHLRIMRYEDVLESKTEGRRRYYWVKRPKLLEFIEKIGDRLRRAEDK